ncbi:MAG: RNA polymerase subunit sigma-24 [Kiritimatiellaceae bacterium]|nr:RNA polymerase subunit sigma-24 [Kiritimatiellaceae bacterium]
MNDKKINNGPETWVDDHGDYLLQYAYVRLRNSAAAEDAVQETFLAGYKAFERYNGKTPVRYWLRGILRHKVVDYIRKSSREVPIDDTENNEILDSFNFKALGIFDQNPPDWKFDPEHAFERKEFMKIFYECISEMKDNLAQAFVLREIDGLSTDEICKQLNLTPNNLWVILHRARKQLKSCLESKWTKEANGVF